MAQQKTGPNLGSVLGESSNELPVAHMKTTPTQVKPQLAPESAKEKTVTLSESDFTKLMERVTNLEKGIKGEDILDEEKKMSILLRLYEGLPVTNIISVFPIMGEDRKEELYIKFSVLNTAGTPQEAQMKYLQFLKLDKITTEVNSTRREPTKILQGYTERVHNDGHNMVRTGEKVPVRILGTKDSFLVTLPDGREVELNESAVN